MTRHHRTLSTLVTAVAIAAVGLAGCGSSPHNANGAQQSGATTSTSVAAPSAGTAAPPTGPKSASSPSAGASAGGGAPRPGSSPGPASASGSGTSQIGANPTPAAHGTYYYRQSGSETFGTQAQAVPSQGKNVIDAPSATGVSMWSQTTHAYVDPSQAPSDTSFVFEPSGIYVTGEVFRYTTSGQTIAITCTFNPPLHVMAWPPAVGYKVSGQANCGSFTASVNTGITGTQQTTLDGAPVTAYVLQTSSNAQGTIKFSVVETDWFDAAARLTVHTVSSTQGSYGVLSFHGQATRDIVSGVPQ